MTCPTSIPETFNNNIPPRILNLLVTLAPFIYSIRQLTDILQWQSTHRRHSIVVVLLWNGLCFFTWYVLVFIPPLILLYKLKKRPQKKCGQVLLDDTLQNIRVINASIDLVRERVNWIKGHYLDGTRHEIVMVTLTRSVYLVPLWILLLVWMGTHGTLALIGSSILLWPWSKRSVILHQIGNKKLTMLQRDDNNALRKNKVVFQFKVYENQRWWLGENWTTNMLLGERGPWTDNHLVTVPSKEEFELPETTEKRIGNQMMIKVWNWMDNDWWVDMTGELDGRIDHSGWEYGNNAWDHFTGKLDLQTFTRRRLWCRRAQLVVHQCVNGNSNEPTTCGL